MLSSPGWTIGQPDAEQARALQAALRISHPMALVLVQRGLSEPEAAQRFLEPRLQRLRAPEGMAGFARAVERLARALCAGEVVGVFGDYDVDGVTTAALLAWYLRGCGAKVHAEV